MEDKQEKLKGYEPILEESLGQQHVHVMNHLLEPSEDLVLSKKLEMDKQELRKILNVLLENRLVSYVKVTDEATGSRKTIWQLRKDQLENYSLNYLENKIRELDETLSFNASNMAYRCGCRIIDYAKAVEDLFVCKKCKKPYQQYTDPHLENKVMELTRLTSLLTKLT